VRALLVDDSKTIRTILKKYLLPLGVECFEAENGAEALLRLGELGPVDCVLLDWNMPFLDGLSVVKVVRANPRYATTRIVLVTTETELEQVALALGAGADEYVMKPFTQAVIVEKLAMLGLLEPT
jgi:two-component system, chemotaxis family, chemotaxis protein CheY